MKSKPSENLIRAPRPRLSDVAARCQVSKATVSRVLSLPADECPIAESTRLRVLAAVAELGYQPSWNARSLANNRTNMIAIAYDSSGAVPRGVYWEVVDELDVLLNQAGLCPMFMHTYANVGRFLENLGDGRFDGCLSLGVLPPAALEVLRRNNVPTVLINAEPDEAWNQVRVDDAMGTRLAMDHLLALGHRRIAYNAGRKVSGHPSAKVRSDTYLATMREAGLEPDRPFVGSVEDFAAHVIDGPYRPTAILDFEHWTAVRVLQQLWRRGKTVPGDFSLVTFNDTYPVQITMPPLTTVGLPAREIAAHAMRLLLRQIEDPDAPRQSVFLGENLVVRESTAGPSAKL
ncbi:MAG: LacI family DNA-binding transcriptional regulator [Tepidisphaeraceae bacterium]